MVQDLVELAQRSRLRAVKMCETAKGAHIGSSLSVIDILVSLYSCVGEDSCRSQSTTGGDRIIVSKGHAAAGTYAVMAEFGIISEAEISTYGSDSSRLGGHVSSEVPGIELSTGSLGHGLPYGVGLALAAVRDQFPSRVYVVLSDGECNEGTTWESALLAAHHNLSLLTVLIDRNRLQSLAGTEDTLRLEPLGAKWEAFGWQVFEVDGHDHSAIKLAVRAAADEGRCPTVIICNTIKGKGVSFMENSVDWHYRPPSAEEAARAAQDLGAG